MDLVVICPTEVSMGAHYMAQSIALYVKYGFEVVICVAYANNTKTIHIHIVLHLNRRCVV